MKSFVVLSFALVVAMAAPQNGVQVVDNPNGVRVVDNSNPLADTILYNPDQAFYRPAQGNQGQYVDPGFYQPSVNPSGGYQRPDISPALVQYPQQQNPGRYPGKQYDNPFLRGGK